MTIRDDPAAGGPCRTRGDARRQALLDAAWRLFLDKGYERTTLGDIIAMAGGSRSTLYEAFGDKDGLFATVIGTRCREFVDRLKQVSLSDADPAAALTDFGIHFAREVFSEDTPRLMRLMIANGEHLPGVVDSFLTGAADEVRALLARYFRDAQARGQLRLEDPERAASAFIGMLQGDWFTRFLMRPADLPTDEQIRHHVSTSVALLLDGARRR